MTDDYCYVTLKNNLKVDLTFSSKSAAHGYWDVNPPTTVKSQTTSLQMRLKDNFGFYGSEGGYVYKFNHMLEQAQNTSNSFSCPYSDDNSVSTSISTENLYQVTYRAKSGDGAWQNNSCPKRGHPLYVDFTVDYRAISTKTDVSVISADGDYTVQNSFGSVVSITAPVWQTGANVNDGTGSRLPAAFNVIAKSSVLTVTLAVDNALAGVGFVLVGALGGTDWFRSSAVIGKPGQQAINVSLQSSFAVFGRIMGDVSWRIEVQYSNQIIALPSNTRLELYWLPGRPAWMFTKGVWVKVLRSIAAGTSATTQSQLSNDITKVCFVGFQFKYDTFNGASFFDVSTYGDYINLARVYHATAGQLCNCYDQAGLAQCLLGAVGITSSKSWAFLAPFGFIKTTNLIGWGNCNNPFFRGVTSKMIVPVNDPNRSLFGNHAFLSLSGDVFDTCQGPYNGSKSLSSYLGAAIDTTTTLYSHYPAPYDAPGSSGDIEYYVGIYSVEAPPPMALQTLPQTRLVAAFANKLSAAALADDPAAQRFVVCDWEEQVVKGAIFGPGATVVHDHVAVGVTEGVREWIVEQGGVEIGFQVRIFPGGSADAYRRLAHIVAAISNDDPEAFDVSVADLGHVALSSKSGSGFIVWTWCNATFRLWASDAGPDLAEIARRVQTVAQEHTRNEFLSAVPELGELRHTEEKIAVGDVFRVGAREAYGARLDMDLRGEALMLTEMLDHTLGFIATAPGTAQVTVIRADDRTLYASGTTIDVSVTD